MIGVRVEVMVPFANHRVVVYGSWYTGIRYLKKCLHAPPLHLSPTPRSHCTTFRDPLSWNLEQASCISNAFFTLNLNSMKSCFTNSVLNLMKCRFTNSVRMTAVKARFNSFNFFMFSDFLPSFYS